MIQERKPSSSTPRTGKFTDLRPTFTRINKDEFIVELKGYGHNTLTQSVIDALNPPNEILKDSQERREFFSSDPSFQIQQISRLLQLAAYRSKPELPKDYYGLAIIQNSDSADVLFIDEKRELFIRERVMDIHQLKKDESPHFNWKRLEVAIRDQLKK